MSDQQSKLDAQAEAGSGLASALARLNKALDSLDNAVDAAVESGSGPRSASEEVQRMADDRSKLAQELDSSVDRAKRLEDTNREVSRRLVAAMETVRGVLDRPV
ncbi:MAG: DUF4164 domain-containing protein [Rhizobiaceae bacterium]